MRSSSDWISSLSSSFVCMLVFQSLGAAHPAENGPSWIASLTGKLGAQAGSDAGAVVVLEQAAVQVFERKAKWVK